MQYDKNVKHRLRRIEGQVRGVLKMMDEEKDCKDVITQLSAARNALDRTIGVLVSTNLIACVNEGNSEEKEELVKEAVNLLVKSR